MRVLVVALCLVLSSCAFIADSFRTPASGSWNKHPIELNNPACADPPPEFEAFQKKAFEEEGAIVYWVATPCTLKAD